MYGAAVFRMRKSERVEEGEGDEEREKDGEGGEEGKRERLLNPLLHNKNTVLYAYNHYFLHVA